MRMTYIALMIMRMPEGVVGRVTKSGKQNSVLVLRICIDLSFRVEMEW